MKAVVNNPGGIVKAGINKSVGLMASAVAAPAMAQQSLKTVDATAVGIVAGKVVTTVAVEGTMAVATEGAGNLVRSVASKAGRGVATTAEATSEMSAKSPMSAINLNKQLGSEAQLAEEGVTIAGGNTGTELRKAGSLAEQYGGEPSDWVKKSSSSHTATDGTKFETHWEQNTQTGQRVNQKTKIGD